METIHINTLDVLAIREKIRHSTQPQEHAIQPSNGAVNGKLQLGIAAHSVYRALGSLTFNASRFKPIHLSLAPTSEHILMLYLIEGEVDYFSGCGTHSRSFDCFQNVLIYGTRAELVFRPNPLGNFKCNLLILDKEAIPFMSNGHSELLEPLLVQAFNGFRKEESVVYAGKVRPSILPVVKNLMFDPRNGIVDRLFVDSAVLQILASQLSYYQKDRTSQHDKSPLLKQELLKIMEIGEHIQEHLDKKNTVEELTQKFLISPKKLQIGFNFLYNESVHSFIKGARLKKARELLEHSDLSISEICYTCGISSRSYFSRMFKESFNMSPSEYREMIGSSC